MERHLRLKTKPVGIQSGQEEERESTYVERSKREGKEGEKQE